MRRLLAVAGVAATLLGATVMATPAVAAPGAPTQVALVVDYPDGTRKSFCVGYSSGMSGADVLAVAGPAYGSGPYAGFVLKIGGQGTVPPTSSNYWAYWRSSGAGAFTYSGSGVTSTRPAAGSVEAWHWNSSGSAEQPSGGSYASLCPSGVATTPAPASPAPTSSRVAAPTGSGGGPGTTVTSAAPAPGSTGSSASASASGAPGAAGTVTPSAATTTPSIGGTSAPVPTGPTTSVAAGNAAATTDEGGLGAGATIGLLVAAVAVVAFGVLTVVARRRRPDQD